MRDARQTRESPKLVTVPTSPYPPICDGFLSLFSILTIRCRPDTIAFCTLLLHSTFILPTVAGIYALLNIYTFDAAIRGLRGVNVGCLGRR